MQHLMPQLRHAFSNTKVMLLYFQFFPFDCVIVRDILVNNSANIHLQDLIHILHLHQIQTDMKKVILTSAIIAFCFQAYSQQIVQMKTGEKLNGLVQSLNNGVLSFYYKGEVKKISTSDIYAINFGETGESIGGESKAKIEREPGEKQITSGSYMVRYKVAERLISRAPKVDNLTQEKGTVVVEISIDKYGHVKKAIPGAPGSTSTSEYLKTKAKQAAESAIFDNIPTAPLEQKGYMVIVF